MKRLINRVVRSLVLRLREAMRSSRRVRNLISDGSNVSEFGDLFEHEKMLADKVRVETYRDGIERHIKPGDVVIDLGTGSGLLSLFAAQRKPRKIYAIDHGPIIDLAQYVAVNRGLCPIPIEFVRSNSRDFTAPESVDVILHEQIGDELFDENMVENLLDLKRRLLKQSGRIVPGKFDLFLEPVQLNEGDRVPYIWENPVLGLEPSFLRDWKSLRDYQRKSYSRRWIERSAIDSLLCEPMPLISVDLNTMVDSSDLPSDAQAARPAVRSGRMDGLLLYFGAAFDEQIRFDSSPFHSPTPSWGNLLLRTESLEYRAGDVISYKLEFGNLIDVDTWELSMASKESPA